jgi:hypothetical protein
MINLMWVFLQNDDDEENDKKMLKLKSLKICSNSNILSFIIFSHNRRSLFWVHPGASFINIFTTVTYSRSKLS